MIKTLVGVMRFSLTEKMNFQRKIYGNTGQQGFKNPQILKVWK
jgi:hypothetical protein